MTYDWIIKQVKPETPTVSSLYLQVAAERPSFIAGQYLTVKLPGIEPAEGKSYSIASPPQDDMVRLTVKRAGRFSSALLALRPGETVTTSAPYGFFYPEPDGTAPLVFLAGGIGITPCFTIITNCLHTNDPRGIYLLYSNRTEADIVFKDELDLISSHQSNLHVHHFITRETPPHPEYTPGRIDAERIRLIVPDVSAAEFFLCGSLDFTGSLTKELRALGVSQQKIYTEGFF